jgi:hypothetical protein
MTLTDILMILATACSPLIAVQVTRHLDDRNEERGRKLSVFKTLMATRAANLSLAHVEALNRIDLEFSTKKPQEKAVLDVWQQYLDHLGNNAQLDTNIWSVRRLDLLVDLLYEMSRAVGYEFNKIQIKNGTYSPIAHGKIEEEQLRVRMLVLELLEGKRDLPMRVTSFPTQNAKTSAEEI